MNSTFRPSRQACHPTFQRVATTVLDPEDILLLFHQHYAFQSTPRQYPRLQCDLDKRKPVLSEYMRNHDCYA